MNLIPICTSTYVNLKGWQEHKNLTPTIQKIVIVASILCLLKWFFKSYNNFIFITWSYIQANSKLTSIFVHLVSMESIINRVSSIDQIALCAQLLNTHPESTLIEYFSISTRTQALQYLHPHRLLSKWKMILNITSNPEEKSQCHLSIIHQLPSLWKKRDSIDPECLSFCCDLLRSFNDDHEKRDALRNKGIQWDIIPASIWATKYPDKWPCREITTENPDKLHLAIPSMSLAEYQKLQQNLDQTNNFHLMKQCIQHQCWPDTCLLSTSIQKYIKDKNFSDEDLKSEIPSFVFCLQESSCLIEPDFQKNPKIITLLQKAVELKILPVDARVTCSNNTLLYLYLENLEFVQFLIKQGADPLLLNFNATPLDRALTLPNNRDVMHALLKSPKIMTTIQPALANKISQYLVEILIQNNNTPTDENIKEWMPLFRTLFSQGSYLNSKTPTFSAHPNTIENVLLKALELGCLHPDEPLTLSGECLVHLWTRNEKLLSKLLSETPKLQSVEKESSINCKNNAGNTPLDVALANDQPPIVLYLLQQVKQPKYKIVSSSKIYNIIRWLSKSVALQLITTEEALDLTVKAVSLGTEPSTLHVLLDADLSDSENIHFLEQILIRDKTLINVCSRHGSSLLDSCIIKSSPRALWILCQNQVKIQHNNAIAAIEIIVNDADQKQPLLKPHETLQCLLYSCQSAPYTEIYRNLDEKKFIKFIALLNSPEAVDFFIQEKKINTPITKDHFTPVYYASQGSNLPALKKYISHGATLPNISKTFCQALITHSPHCKKYLFEQFPDLQKQCSQLPQYHF